MSEGGSFFGSDWLGAFLIIAILFGGGFGGFGGRGPVPNLATVTDVNTAIANQSTQTGIRVYYSVLPIITMRQQDLLKARQ